MYQSKLSLRESEKAIKYARQAFQNELESALNLERISAPLFVDAGTGLNDNLNGIERPVSFDIKETGRVVEIVHSLAKWKRLALKRYEFEAGCGLYTDMNAIRRDEDTDRLHSIYVDQWDWEKVISDQDRTIETLKATVKSIISSLCKVKSRLKEKYKQLDLDIKEEVHFVTTGELEKRYPHLTPKERENVICKEHKTVFIMQIGDKLESGKPHDGRSPDYDDWGLNGDILLWYEPLDTAIEISSMGIRVNEKSLDEQLNKAGCNERREYPFHKMLLNGELPNTMGGGIGQSRVCMILLEKVHVGEVQVSVWREDMIKECADNGIFLL